MKWQRAPWALTRMWRSHAGGGLESDICALKHRRMMTPAQLVLPRTRRGLIVSFNCVYSHSPTASRCLGDFAEVLCIGHHLGG